MTFCPFAISKGTVTLGHLVLSSQANCFMGCRFVEPDAVGGARGAARAEAANINTNADCIAQSRRRWRWDEKKV